MESIKQLYKIGYGPSSSHTMGPGYASTRFLSKNPNATHFKVTLYGSLAMTGKGHLTDVIIQKILGKERTIVEFNYQTTYNYHPNAMRFEAYINDTLIDEELVFSVGGGDLRHEGENRQVKTNQVYQETKMSEILSYCQTHKLSLLEYIRQHESNDSEKYFEIVYDTMKKVVERGITKEGMLPGGLNVLRKASSFYQKYLSDPKEINLQYAYALAASEENATGGEIVTAPTCGSCGVVPSILVVEEKINKRSKKELVNALMIGGLIGTIVKTNASISGAEVGCQGEIGVACSMAAGMLAYLNGGSNEEIEYAAEIALEHHLGMTCDPIDGLVQIPCIERNAIASVTARNSAEYALIAGGKHYVTFDSVVEVMRETGIDLHAKYRETSAGGLALQKNIKREN